jgi:hypothetical protein
MNDNMSRLSLLSVSDTEYFNDKKDKIELINCPFKEKRCTNHLSVINKSFLEADRGRRNKDFNKSIESLKSAFYVTTELQGFQCVECAKLFQSAITQSMENIHGELAGMSTGFFRRKRYLVNYKEAGRVLAEFKNEGKGNVVYLPEEKKQFVKNTLISKVAGIY